jgi:hypothetical protein
LTLKVNSTLATLSDYVIKIQIFDGIKNPPSTYCDRFMLYIYDSLNNVKDYNDAVQISYSPGVLNTVSITSSSNVCGAIANLTFSFTPSQPILQSGIISIKFPWFNQNAGTINYISMFPNTANVTLKINSVFVFLNLGNKFKFYFNSNC